MQHLPFCFPLRFVLFSIKTLCIIEFEFVFQQIIEMLKGTFIENGWSHQVLPNVLIVRGNGALIRFSGQSTTRFRQN